MTIPVYVVTGFLESGKTSFLNRVLNDREEMYHENLVLQFESGEEELSLSNPDCHVQVFSKKEWEQSPDKIVEKIYEILQDEQRQWQQIWVEWNGMVKFAELNRILLDASLQKLCRIEKLIHVGDAEQIEYLLGRTGEALPEQIASSDLIILRNQSSADKKKKNARILKELNPGVQIEDFEEKSLHKIVMRRRENPIDVFFLVLLWGTVLAFFAKPVLESMQIPVTSIANVFLGIILQAIPFLIIGVLLSSAIQIFIPQKWIEEKFPKSFLGGMLTALIGGFCLPVCDCASIPIFKSLVKKGVPLPAAVTFMTAAPVINPVVMLSTYYAFGGNGSVVLLRVGFGIVTSVVIGIVMGAMQKNHAEALSAAGRINGILCSCGCYTDVDNVSGYKGKIELFLRHAQTEFFDVGKYLVIGTFIASIFQVMGAGIFSSLQGTTGLAVSLIIMMLMAFLLSLCSSSDAVIGRSFANQFPMGAIMGFLVFGPMMDIKNLIMLSSGFSKKFVGKFLLVTAAVCFAFIFAFYAIGGRL